MTEQNQTTPAPEIPASPPVREQPIRRVGTFTMGVALVAAGITALAAMFFPGFDPTLAFRLSPLIFLLLGAELILAHFQFPNVRLKYDFLSTVVCFFLLCAAACLAVIPSLWNYLGPPAMEARSQLQGQLETQLRQKLSDQQQIEGMYLQVELPYYERYTATDSYEELLPQSNIRLHFALFGPYGDAQSFAQDCALILEKLAGLEEQLNWVEFSCRQGPDFSLYLNSPFRLNFSPEQLASMVESPEEELEGSEEELDGLEIDSGYVYSWPDFVRYDTQGGMSAHSFLFDLPVDGPTQLLVDLATESGSLQLQILAEDGTILFDSTTQDAFPAQISLPAAGNYRCQVNADHHVGFFTLENLS